MNVLTQFLSSKVRAETCRLLFGSQDEELHVRELSRRLGMNFSAVQRELEKLASMGLISKRKDGNRTYFSANKTHPFFVEIQSLVRKSSGMVEALRSALNDQRIQFAFIFGSVAAGKEKPGSDIDLMVIGTLSLMDVTRLLHRMDFQFGREVNPHVFTRAEFVKRLQAKDHFLTTVVREPKQCVIGDEHELEGMA